MAFLIPPLPERDLRSNTWHGGSTLHETRTAERTGFLVLRLGFLTLDCRVCGRFPGASQVRLAGPSGVRFESAACIPGINGGSLSRERGTRRDDRRRVPVSCRRGFCMAHCDPRLGGLVVRRHTAVGHCDHRFPMDGMGGWTWRDLGWVVGERVLDVETCMCNLGRCPDPGDHTTALIHPSEQKNCWRIDLTRPSKCKRGALPWWRAGRVDWMQHDEEVADGTASSSQR